MAKIEEGPDQARSWAIALAACVINSLLSGITRTAGLFYVALIDTYGVSRLEANLPFTLRNVVRNLAGPLAGAIGQRYGARDVTIVGGIFAALGIILCTFAPNVIWISIFWGGIHGLGVALGNTLFPVTVNQYFLKYRATASGLALSGACFGSFVFPVALEYLLTHLGLSGTFLIAGGCVMHVLPAAMMMKEPPWIRKQMKARREIEKMTAKRSFSTKREKVLPTRPSMSAIHEEGKHSDSNGLDEITTPNLSKIASSGLLLDVPKDDPRINGETGRISGGEDNPAFTDERSANQVESEFVNQLRIRTISIGDVSVTIAPPDNQETSIYKGIIKVFRDPMFHMISLSLAAFAMLFDPTITVIVDYLKDKGLDAETAKYFISLMSLGDLLGRLGFGWVTDKNYLSMPKFMMLLQIVQGISFLLLPIFYRFEVLMTLVIVFGLSSGATLVMYPILIAKYLASVQALAIGFISITTGVLSFGIPSLIGYFRDEVGSYDGMFYITGWLSVAVGCLWFLEPLLIKLRDRLENGKRSASIIINP